MAAPNVLQTELIAAEVDFAAGAVRALRTKAGVEILSSWQGMVNGDASKLAFTKTELPEQGPDPWLPLPRVPPEQSLALRATLGALTLTRVFVAHERSLILVDVIQNGPSDSELLYAQRLVFSPQILNEHTRVDVPATGYFDAKDDPPLRMRWPQAADGTDFSVLSKGVEREIFVTDFDEGHCALGATHPVHLAWNCGLMPYLWVQRNVHGVTLQPATGMPDALEAGHGLLRLEPGQVENVGVQVTLA